MWGREFIHIEETGMKCHAKSNFKNYFAKKEFMLHWVSLKFYPLCGLQIVMQNEQNEKVLPRKINYSTYIYLQTLEKKSSIVSINILLYIPTYHRPKISYKICPTVSKQESFFKRRYTLLCHNTASKTNKKKPFVRLYNKAAAKM